MLRAIIRNESIIFTHQASSRSAIMPPGFCKENSR